MMFIWLKKKNICDPTLHIPLSLSLSLSNDIMLENLVDVIATATHSSTPSNLQTLSLIIILKQPHI